MQEKRNEGRKKERKKREKGVIITLGSLFLKLLLLTK